MQRRLRFSDLQELGVVRNRPTLKNLIDKYGFPPGALTGMNSRTWGEDEVQEWINTRPTERKPSPNKRRRQTDQAEATSASEVI